MNIGKITSLIFQAILVILAVIVFSYFDPFNIFNTKTLNMKDTPVIVEGIQSIGKLITAEYYGEVIQASGEELQEKTDSASATERKQIIEMENEVIRIVDNIRTENENAPKKIRNRKQQRVLIEEKGEFEDDLEYQLLLDFADKQYKLNKKELLNFYFEHKGSKLNNYQGKDGRGFNAQLDDYLTKKYGNTKGEERRIANHSLVILGRGSVKAGIDFSSFDEKYLSYLPDRNLVRLLHHRPEIISATINPWFIPEKKIKGFEYLSIGKKIDNGSEASLAIVQDMKSKCLNNLINNARDAGIMEEAKKQAEENLGHLLSLLLGKDIKVEIYSDPLEAFEYDIFKDPSHFITKRDLCSVDSMVSKRYEDAPDLVFDFIKTIRDTLKSEKKNLIPWRGAEKDWGIMAVYFRIAEDNFLTVEEKEFVKKCKANNIPNLKSYLYQAAEDSTFAKHLDSVKFDMQKMPASLKTQITKSKKDNLDSLDVYSKKLRTPFVKKTGNTEHKIGT